MAEKTLHDLFHETLKDVYYLEKRLTLTFTKMAKGAGSQELSIIFEKHRDEAETQVQRLGLIFGILGKQPEGRAWTAVDGIVEEAHAILVHYRSSPALDAGLVAAAQTIEHYALIRYSTLKRWAGVLGLTDATRLFNAILRDQWRTNAELSVLAELFPDADTVWNLPHAQMAARAPCLSEAA
jgi:ferritin-like metal-binding protein YciE